MRKKVSAVLIISFLFYSSGCTSFYSLNDDEEIDGYLNHKSSLLFILKNGKTITTNSSQCFFINEPKNFIFGIGDILNKKTGSISYFKSEIKRETLDSSRSVFVDDKKYYIYWINDSLRVTFEEGKILDLVPDSGSGYWYVSNIDNNQKFEKTYSDDISEIQVSKINYFTTGLIVVSILAITALMIAIGPAFALTNSNFN